MTAAERVWRHVVIGGPDECWPWTGARNEKGYGLIRLGGASEGHTMSHRAAYESWFGPIPDPEEDEEPILACHRCDNPPCCNPGHLFLGTVADNNADRDEKGRQRSVGQPGESNPGAVLKNEDVIEIRTRRVAGDSCTAIALDFPVSRQTVWKIGRGEKWSHLNDQAPRELSTAQTRGA